MENTKRRYYGGVGKNLGLVDLLPCVSFKELIDQYFNLTATLPFSRTAYWKMDKQERAKKKITKFIVPCTYPATDTNKGIARKKNDAEKLALVFLDIDDPEAAKPLVREVEYVTRQMGEISFCMYKTASYTDENPKVRLVVDVENLELDQHNEAVYYISRLLGLPDECVNTESLLIHQPMFVPTMFREDDPIIDHPIIVESHGRGLRSEDLPDTELPQKNFKSRERDVDEFSFDDLAFVKPRVEGATIESVAKALEYVDPDLPYADWLKIAAALRHQFSVDNEEEAFELFDRWSSKGSKYSGEKDTRAKWDSLKWTPKGSMPITLRTLIAKALENGWNDGEFKDDQMESILTWLNSYNGSQAKFVDKAMMKVGAVVNLTAIEEEILLQEIAKLAKTSFNMRVSMTTLKKEIKRIRKELTETGQYKESRPQKPKWANGLCFVEQEDCFYRPHSGMSYSPAALNRAYGRELTAKVEDHVEGSKPDVLPADYLLNFLRITTVYEKMFDPTRPESVYIRDTETGHAYVNTYRPCYPKPVKEEEDYAKEVIEGHVREIIVDKDVQDIVLSFIAYNVQNPGKKIRWAILLQGVEGCGKGTIFDIASTAIGRRNCEMIGPEAVTSSWTDWAEGRLLLGLDEIRVSGENRYRVMNKLKPLITNSDIGINRKFADSKEVPNYTNYFLFTNHHDALPLNEGNRRYFVIKSKYQTRTQVERGLGPKYFQRIYDMLENYSGGVRSYFENYELHPKFNPNDLPFKTNDTKQMEDETKSTVTVAISDIIDDGLEGQLPIITADVVSATKVQEIMEFRGYGKQFAMNQIYDELRSRNYKPSIRTRLKDGQRHSLWINCTLELEGTEVRRMANDAYTVSTDPDGRMFLSDDIL